MIQWPTCWWCPGKRTCLGTHRHPVPSIEVRPDDPTRFGPRPVYRSPSSRRQPSEARWSIRECRSHPGRHSTCPENPRSSCSRPDSLAPSRTALPSRAHSPCRGHPGHQAGAATSQTLSMRCSAYSLRKLCPRGEGTPRKPPDGQPCGGSPCGPLSSTCCSPSVDRPCPKRGLMRSPSSSHCPCKSDTDPRVATP